MNFMTFPLMVDGKKIIINMDHVVVIEVDQEQGSFIRIDTVDGKERMVPIPDRNEEGMFEAAMLVDQFMERVQKMHRIG